MTLSHDALPHAEPPTTTASTAAAQTAPFSVVGIGASAGGLKALQTLFEALPADSGMAYVVIMHLDPVRESRIAEILQDRTSVKVTQVTASTNVEPNHIYIIPPDRDLEMSGTLIRLVDRGDRPLHAPVDLFFRTLGDAYGAQAIGVVLSGTGSDGTFGIRHIKACGGITVAQLPEEADREGMPGSAIASGQVDLVLPAAKIPGELVRLRQMPSVIPGDEAETDAQLEEVFTLLRGRTGHDFSRYKRSTIMRRIERRLRFNGARTLADYVPVLRGDAAEARALMQDMLISVSGFFRDPEAFAALAEAVPAMFDGKGADDIVRVWVAGCATGEEAYSVAIVLHEHAATLEQPPRIQIFATDIDEKGYASGREGLYSAAAVADIAPERLRRFFTREAGGFRIIKAMRECVLFAVHNVLHDPPFSRLDLISCRNVLIYLQPDAQERIAATFHYALSPGGLLLLGASESTGESGLFLSVGAASNRLYRRNLAAHAALPRPSAADLAPRLVAVPSTLDKRAPGTFPHASGTLHLSLLEHYAPPSLITDERLEIVHRSALVGRYLHLGEGAPSHKLLDLVRPDLRTELRSALHEAFEKGLPTTTRTLDGPGGSHPLVLRVYPPMTEPGAGRYALVVFDEQQPRSTVRKPPRAGSARALARLEEELAIAYQQLDAISATRDRTVQELQSSNEELQSINEEQKAAAEELEASREEIQSINEELTTINQEHQSTIEELKSTNADLQNLIESTEIGTVFLDRTLGIRRFTPSACTLFNFVATDRGRPLAHITHRLDYADLVVDAQSVLTSLARIEREVRSDTGEWYLVRINPYRSQDDNVDGAVLTFINVSAHKQVEEELLQAKVAAEAANVAKSVFLSTVSHEFRTPLNAVLGYAELLRIDPGLTEEQTSRVDRIKAGSWHLASMIDQILGFARLDAGRDAVVLERVDARELAREAMELIEPGAAAKHLEFKLEVPDAIAWLNTDRVAARQVLLNLCGNAVKYTERGQIRLRVHANAERVEFEVVDTGIGIAPAHHASIFERFWQVTGPGPRSDGGLGIGLAAAREYSHLLGGDIEVESKLGLGSTFRLWLPRVEPSDPALS